MVATQARTAEEAFWTLDPFEQVAPGHPFFANLERHFADDQYALVQPLIRRVAPPTAGVYRQVAVVGHRGAGKTTMVRSAMAKLAAGGKHRAAYIDVVGTLDISDFAFADVLMAVVNAAISALKEDGGDLPQQELELFTRWFADEERVETRDKVVDGAVEASAAVSGGLLGFVKLTGRLTSQLRANTTYRQQLRIRVDRDPRELLTRANQVLDAVSTALGKQLIIVFDNLEKVNDRAVVDRALLQRADEVRSLRASAVLFLHPSDQYAPVKVRADDAFDVVTVPMLPVRRADDPHDQVAPEALLAVRELLERRVQFDLVFEQPTEVVQLIARYSGGRLRDAIELARLGCERASARKVSVAMIERAARRMAGDRAGLLRLDDLPRLVDVAQRKRVPSDDTHGYLLLHSLILQYNGQPWWDIHPLLRLDREVQTALASAGLG
jgi:hypothetical protein